MIEKFRFDDGGRFDFGGEKQFSYQQRNGNLSNSNQRAKKGFVETFQFQRSYSVAKFKIDWIFVKPNLDQAFSPAHGQTLKALNYSSKQVPISDHSPVTVKLLL